MMELTKRVQNFFLHKDEGVSALVVTAILIVVAVILCMIFKDQIAGMLETVINNIEGKVNAELGN